MNQRRSPVDGLDYFPTPTIDADWFISNPPFNYSLEFLLLAWEMARVGVAFLLRLNWLESATRYEQMFARGILSKVLTFSERLPMVEGRVDPEATSATSYAWFIFDKSAPPVDGFYRGGWIPPCRRALEREGDYRDRGFVEHAPARETPGLLTACT